MKVVTINGSNNKKGNTAQSLKLVTNELVSEGIEVIDIVIGKEMFHQCTGCGYCSRMKNEECVFKDDKLNEIYQQIKDCDGLLLGSPVHYAGLSGTMKTMLDRLIVMVGANKNPLRLKVGASVAAVRRSGGIPAINEMNEFLAYCEMIIPSSNYWTVIHGSEEGEVLKDSEGCQIMRVLGKNMAYTLKVLDYSKGHIKKPEKEKKIWMNFIR